MKKIDLREPRLSDETEFLVAMQRSQILHYPWIKAPSNSAEFKEYLQRYQQNNQASFLICSQENNIVGVININEIVRGSFQSAYLGFYAVADYVGQGYMSAGLKAVLQKTFKDHGLHRLEANIQPENHPSINLVKSNGFRYEGYSPRYLKIYDKWCDHERWAITSEEYCL